jgi:hypothetical protein
MAAQKKIKREKCPKRIALGSFMLATGIAVALDIFLNDIAVVFEKSYRPAISALIWALLIVWVFGGLWILLYGWWQPCPKEFE